MKKSIEEENRTSIITESPFALSILIGEYCTLSANEIVRFENKLNSSPVFDTTHFTECILNIYAGNQPT